MSFIAALFRLNGTASRLFSYWNLRLNEVETNRQIVDTASVGFGRRRYFVVNYTFEFDGNWTGQATITESERIMLTKGMSIPIWYLSGDPEQNEIVKGKAVWRGTFHFSLASVSALLCIVGVWLGLRRAHQWITLRRTGLKLSAKVTTLTLTGVEGSKSRLWQVVWQGETGASGTSIQPNRINFYALPPKGTTITIYADPSGKLPSVWEGDCGAR